MLSATSTARRASTTPTHPPMPHPTSTIFATALGRAAIAIIRLSGPAARAILTALTANHLPAPRKAALRTLRHPTDGTVLDRAITIWLPAPATYTGEDSAELHLHAGPAVLADVADALVTLGALPAEPGEFIRRAFLNNRLDLLEAEALNDLVTAETTAQRRQALRQPEGVAQRGVRRGSVALRYSGSRGRPSRIPAAMTSPRAAPAGCSRSARPCRTQPHR